MNFKLRKPINNKFSTTEQILFNRGIAPEDARHWLNTSDADINDYALLGLDRLKAAAHRLLTAIQENQKTLVIVDSDADGFCSSAILINYLHELFPYWVENYISWFIHGGKQHGLSDVNVEELSENNFSLVLTPDGSSEDYEYHLNFAKKGIDIIVLDHHEAKFVSPNAIVINNQLCDYPNKQFCGAGVTWQFCRYLDEILQVRNADNYLDLVALGNISDMMSLRSIETKHLIFKGLLSSNIKNPFFSAMMHKQEYSLSKKSLADGVAWYITPYINAMNRSGTQEEKELLFRAFLGFHAYTMVLSDKRGHAPGEMETVVTQSLRVVDRVKRRQSDAQDSSMATIERLIEEHNLMQHKVLLFLLEPGQVDKNVAGLAANKIMGKYQRPCAILTKRATSDGKTIYEGSARGCDKANVSNFKAICQATKLPQYTAGHPGAFGLGLLEEDIPFFLTQTDYLLSDMSDTPIDFVDYLYKNTGINGAQILEMTEFSNLYGKDIDEIKVGIENLKVSASMVQIYVKRTNTLKITLPDGTALVLFDADQDLCNRLETTRGYIELNILGTPKKNIYNGNVSAQIMIDDYEIIGESRYNF